jgi:uncharacterized protein YjbJ (UPF0337 family)
VEPAHGEDPVALGTDDDLAQIKGSRDVLMGKIQEHYGVSREQVEADVERWLEAERVG